VGGFKGEERGKKRGEWVRTEGLGWAASRAAGAALMWGLAGLRWCGWV
jgi:hypothetical protein